MVKHNLKSQRRQQFKNGWSISQEESLVKVNVCFATAKGQEILIINAHHETKDGRNLKL
jgi:hypothetical protein